MGAGNGSHSVDYSPDRRFLIDSFSRADAPPIHELRRSDNGKLVCELEKAELKRDQIHAYGPDWRLPRSLGSMAAVVEPAVG